MSGKHRKYRTYGVLNLGAALLVYLGLSNHWFGYFKTGTTTKGYVLVAILALLGAMMLTIGDPRNE